MIRKFLAATCALGVFVIYSVGVRHQSRIISNPSSVANGSTPSTTTSTNGSSSSDRSRGTLSTTNPTASTGQYKDGTYTGSSADAYYGNVQVSATISGGKLTNVQFLDYPHTHNTSVVINQQAMPGLKQEAIKAQGSNVQIVSGATFTSQAFAQSLSLALSKAKT